MLPKSEPIKNTTVANSEIKKTNPAAVYEEIPSIVVNKPKINPQTENENKSRIKIAELKPEPKKEVEKPIVVLEKEPIELEIQKGPLKSINPFNEKSFIESEYLRGVTESKDAIPSIIRVLRTGYEADSKGFDLSLRAIILDQFGNFINMTRENLLYLLF